MLAYSQVLTSDSLDAKACLLKLPCRWLCHHISLIPSEVSMLLSVLGCEDGSGGREGKESSAFQPDYPCHPGLPYYI